MSALTVPLVKVEEIVPHANADRLELVRVLGWQIVAQKGTFVVGQQAVYVPPDTEVPEEWSGDAAWGVQKYLSKGVRTKAVKLRGEPSFGFLAPLVGPTADIIAGSDRQVGDNVADLFGLTKYVPQERIFVGDTRAEHVMFTRYTDIDNMRHYPNLIQAGELVWVTEKLHGTNSRVGIVDGELMAGSHRIQRKRPEEMEGEQTSILNPGSSVYWSPLAIPGVSRLLTALSESYRQVVLYGEIVGPNIQKLPYVETGTHYRAFDLMIEGRYVEYGQFLALCALAGIQAVPVLYRGEFDLERIKSLAEGQTTLDATHIREGVVVRPNQERTDPRLGRVILKFVSDAYLTGDFETDTVEVAQEAA